MMRVFPSDASHYPVDSLVGCRSGCRESIWCFESEEQSKARDVLEHGQMFFGLGLEALGGLIVNKDLKLFADLKEG